MTSTGAILSACYRRELDADTMKIEDFIVNAMNDAKIMRLKYERFQNKDLETVVEYKKALDAFYAAVEDLYHYEVYGFFSAKVPARRFNLPCNVRGGCDLSWGWEPYLDDDLNPQFVEVIRFENRRNTACEYDSRNKLCMTVSDKPEILEGRDKCVLSDEEIQRLKNFVIANKMKIRSHSIGELDSCEFLAALVSPEVRQ
jgi:hypothetical protein